jgi:hypothetical protein
MQTSVGHLKYMQAPVDAFWTLNYICLISRVLHHMKQFHCKLILITPFQPRRPWFPDLLNLSVVQPLCLLLVTNLLQQPNLRYVIQIQVFWNWLHGCYRHSLEKRCFFPKLLTASWRTGTQKDYSSKLRQFMIWCRQKNIDSFIASLNTCAGFLSDLYNTIKVYSRLPLYFICSFTSSR